MLSAAFNRARDPAEEAGVRAAFKGEAYQDARGRWVSEGRRHLLIAHRGGANGSQADMAESIGVTPRYMSMLLSGERQPSANVIARLWRAFKIEGHAWGLAPVQYGTPSSVTSAAESAESQG